MFCPEIGLLVRYFCNVSCVDDPMETLIHNHEDFIAASITKSALMEDAGLSICENNNGHYIISEVSGLFSMFTEVKKGSLLLKLQDKEVHEYSCLDEIKSVINGLKTVRIEAVRIPDFERSLHDSALPSQSVGRTRISY